MRHEEDNIQIACVLWFQAQFPKLARLLHHSPNGGKRTRYEAMEFKRMGTSKGLSRFVRGNENKDRTAATDTEADAT